MRTITVILLGIAVAAGIITARDALKLGTKAAAVFIGLWAFFCCVDTYIGTTHGYSLKDETGIHAIIFIIPSLFAFVLQKYLLRHNTREI